MMSPSETTELMKNLKRLSGVDEQLARLHDTKVVLKGNIHSIETEIDTQKRQIEETTNRIKEETHQEHKDEILLKETEEEKSKVQAQLNTAKTNEELRIFKKKRGELQGRISELEDAILAHLTELDKSREDVEERKKLLTGREEEATRNIAQLRAEIAQREQERMALSQKRDAITAQVPAGPLNKYQRVLAREKHHPVVEVRNNTCQGCFMKVTLQEINLIWRGEDLVLCRNCHRILCLPEDEMGESSST